MTDSAAAAAASSNPAVTAIIATIPGKQYNKFKDWMVRDGQAAEQPLILPPALVVADCCCCSPSVSVLPLLR